MAYDFSRYYDNNTELMAGFYAEPEDSLDVVLMGASELWAGYSAAYAYELYGFTSYPFALDSAIISLFESELTEILTHQNPKCIVVDINAALYFDGELFTDDICLQRYLNNIPASWNRTKTIVELVPAENWYYFFCPLAKSHSNWKEFWNQRYSILNYYRIKSEGLILKGNLTHINVYDQLPIKDVSQDFSTEAMVPEAEYYLRSFLEFCRSKDIDNILFVRFPHVISTDWSYERYKQGNAAQQIIAEYGYPCLDLERDAASAGLDYAADFYDEDHLNMYGQKKLTEYLGRYLMEEYGVCATDLTEAQRRNWDKAVEYNRLFYRYCVKCFEAGTNDWVGEDRWTFAKLEALRAESMP